ncbi:MAG TPA: diguanylate cyclase [Armatimonadetes bacterium]|jgi:two-component system sensor histidine kinase/response regulator|nr:diguanylate cyclase [Armatimonadota bacterium]
MTKKLSVLVMEDDKGLARLCQKKLERAGYKVDLYYDGERGLSAFGSGKYDVIVLDHMMPGHDGLDVIRRLGKDGPLPPVVMVTGSGNERLAVEALRMGARDYLIKDVDGRYLDLLPTVIGRAISQQSAEETMQLSAKVFDNAMEGILIADTSLNIISVNKAFTTITGYSSEEVIGNNPRMWQSWRLDFHAYDEMWNCVQEVGKWEGEISVLRKSGEIYPAWLTITAAKDDAGRTTNYIGFLSDITERKQAETDLQQAKDAAEAASRAKSEFLANMSHEIRTPMNGIIGMTELALGTELDPEQREYLVMVKESADALLAVINDILDFSKIEARKMELDIVKFSLRDNLDGALRVMAIRAHSKGLELASHIGPDIPDNLYGDPIRLRQIVMNLIGNAIKFTDHGEIILRAEEESYSPGWTVLKFTVSDTGIGIPEESRERIFEVFAQADGSTSRRYGGTGLGLAISAQLVEMMGGEIWVESQVGRGSAFHFTARFELRSSEARTESLCLPLIAEGKRVLVVDDTAVNRSFLEELLQRWRMVPTVADSGASALEAIKHARDSGKPFDLLILDSRMPGMDGFAVFEQVSDLEFADKTIMMLRPGSNGGDIARCDDMGIPFYLAKPIRQSDLLDRIMTMLGGETCKSIKIPAPKPSDSMQEHSLNILLAEDNPVSQKLAVRILENRGHIVTVAGNGREAVSNATKGTFDVILMDVQMPEMDGFTATAAIREMEKVTGKHIPIIAMTAHAMKGDMEWCLEAGMDDYISKPVHVDEIFAVIARALPHLAEDA